MVRTVSLVALAALCGAPCAILDVAPAAAITRPKKEREPDVRACPEVGEGYIRVPGSDTCVRVGGSVRVEGATIRR